jgi:hypothetical protein
MGAELLGAGRCEYPNIGANKKVAQRTVQQRYDIHSARGRILFVYHRVEFEWEPRSDMPRWARRQDDPNKVYVSTYGDFHFDRREYQAPDGRSGNASVKVQLPYWLVALLLAFTPGLLTVRWAYSKVQRALRPRYACPSCGYDLRATPDRCPECGTVSTPRQ